ncbi:MAG: hypothetical protein ABI696_00205 [Rubrivivax sp.]
MQTQCNPSRPGTQFELRFTSLFDDGRGYAFPCDASGTVDLDAMSERLRNNYLYVRTLIGRDYTAPAVLPRHLH